MGFHAASADDVYRYVLRLDDRNRSLTDRFGLSIFLVNDASPVCNEFLFRYFVDLCHRTADRIRFIFFSNLEMGEVNRMAQTIAAGRYRRGVTGILSGIFHLMSGRRFQDEIVASKPHRRMPPDRLEPWKDLEPAGLARIDFPENTHNALGWERDAHSAVSGVGEACQFAQRLGIGRFMPCIVIVTDIGDLQIDVLPIAQNMSAEDIYNRVREWVDRFYELNRRVLDHWNQVEYRIVEVQKRANQSLQRIREWHDRGKRTWITLRSVNECLLAVSDGSRDDVLGWKRALDAVDAAGLSSSERESVRDLVREIERMDCQPRIASELETLRASVAEAKSFEALWDCFYEVNKRTHSGHGREISDVLNYAMAQMQGRRDLSRGPDEQLKHWLYRIERPLSFNEYKRIRSKRSFCAVVAFKNMRAEFEVLLEALGRLPLMTNIEEGARKVVAVLADYLDHDAESPEWRCETADLKKVVSEFIAKVQNTIPGWLPEELPEAKMEMLIPEIGVTKGMLIGKLFQEDHPVQQAAQRRKQREKESSGLVRQEKEKTADDCRYMVMNTFDAIITNCRISPAVWEQTRAAVVAALQKVRDALTLKLREIDVELFRFEETKLPTDPLDISELRSALDEYSSVVRQIHYPHRSDPLVRSVHLKAPVPEVLGIRGPISPRGPQEELHRNLDKALRAQRSMESERAVLLQDAEQMKSVWTPGGRIAKALYMAVSANRLNEVIPAGLHGELKFRLREALLRDGATEILTALTDLELGEVFRYFSDETEDTLNEMPRTRGALIELILARAGADTRPPLFGQAAMRKFLTDLEPRIDDLPSDEVWNRGVDLRRKLEQFLKQFLALYGPLALTEQERFSLPNQTLGPLVSLMTRVLKRPDPEVAECEGDERWKVLTDRILAAHSEAGWLANIVDALARLPKAANCFAHHVLRDGMELPVGERRRNLRLIVRDSSAIVDALTRHELYPICLRFASVQADNLYVSRFEFDSDPPRTSKEVVAFSQFPPVIPGIKGDVFRVIYRHILLMFPLSNPERIDPLLAPLTPV